jgi:aminopeptidase N
VLNKNLDDMKRVTNQIIYQKGAWSLHMLRKLIGDEKFRAGIREYYQRYRNCNASTADLRKVMEEASGVELEWFFEQWLSRAGSPRLEGTWSYDAGAHKVRVHLAQTQDGAAYRLPLEIGIGGEVQSFEFGLKEQSFEFSAEQEPSAVLLDPETWALVHIDKFERVAGN